MQVYQNLKKYRSDATCEHWLSTIAVDACYDALGKQRRMAAEVPLEDGALSPGDSAREEIGSEKGWQSIKIALAQIASRGPVGDSLTEPGREVCPRDFRIDWLERGKGEGVGIRGRNELKTIRGDNHGN